MSSYGSDDYEPSQLDDPSTVEISPPCVCRSVRTSLAGDRNACFYEAGGALDSQTTDSQFVEGLSYVLQDLPEPIEDLTDTGRQTELTNGGLWHADDTKKSCTCAAEVERLRASLQRLQAAYDAIEERLEQVCAVVNEPVEVLDPTEESQVMLDLHDLSSKKECSRGLRDGYYDHHGPGRLCRMWEGSDDSLRPSKVCKLVL
ncbi:hypothetical protein OH76DRAFT_184814 [Lentinus brumalis]|uniref:Uncharacterized protein n=1 Tax=Lentinus brumalis TaxID=2498619 RepID=A0A371CN44_9APHY|nr:hypothetical protein OH76DRAFT_184814 [Polyporus brumalis]